MILVEYYSHNVNSTLLAICTLAPEEVDLLITSEDLGNNGHVYLQEAIRSLNNKVRINLIQVDFSNLSDLRTTLNNLCSLAKDREIYVNLSDAQELCVIAGYELGIAKKAVPVILDRKAHVLRDVRNVAIEPIELKHFDIDTYITAIGARSAGHSRMLPLESEYKRILSMSDYIFAHLQTWHALCDRLSKNLYRTEVGQEFPIPDYADYNNKHYNIEAMVDQAVEHHFLEQTGENRYLYPNAKYREYMTTYGIWLELATYIHAKSFFNDVRLGYKIDWEGNESRSYVDNEIDVIALYHSEPCFISCKMTEPTVGDLNEIGTIARHLNSNDAHPILVTTAEIREDKDLMKRIGRKFINMKIGLIEAKDFKQAKPELLFLSAIKES